MERDLQQLFREVVEREFAFLVETGHFQGPIPHQPWPLMLILMYVGKNLAVLLILDEMDEDVACEIYRMLDGDLVSFIDPCGRTIGRYIETLLVKHGVPKNEVYLKVGGLSLKDQLLFLVPHYARLLRKYGQKVLEDDLGLLEAI